MNREDAFRTIDALCSYVLGRVNKARKRAKNGDASAEILVAIDRADYVLKQAKALKADFETRCASDIGVFDCHRCNVSVVARWEPPSCPECDDPCTRALAERVEVGRE